MIAAFILLLVALGCARKHRDFINPATLMAGLWSCILIVYKLNIVELNPVHTRTYVVILLGTLCFVFGTAIAGQVALTFGKNASAVTYVVRKPDTPLDPYHYRVNYQLLFYLSVLTVLFSLPDAVYSMQMVAGGADFVYLRSSSHRSIIDNILIRFIKNYFFDPFAIFLYPMSAYAVLTLREGSRREARYKKSIFVLSVLHAVMSVFSSGGRFDVIYFIAYVAVLAVLLKKKIRISRNVKLLGTVLVIAVFVFVYYVSVSRGIENVLESYVWYFCGCIPLLDHYLEAIVSTGSYTFGGAFFYGLLLFISNMINNIGLPNPQFIEKLTQALYVEQNVRVGPDIYMNAFVSWFFYFFKDGGYIALILEAFIYGAAAQGFYKYTIKNRNDTRKMIAYAIITNTILFSMVRYQLINYKYLIALVFPFLFIKKGLI